MRQRLTLFVLGILAVGIDAFAGTLLFPPPDGATQCQNSFVANTCATVQFYGGSFKASTAQGSNGVTVYVGGQSFPSCTSPVAEWTFLDANATEAVITIHNNAPANADGSDVDSQRISLEVTDGTNDDGSPNRITTQHAFPKGSSTTLTASGTAITKIKATVITAFGVVDYNNASWAVESMSAKQPIPPSVNLSIARGADGSLSAVIDYVFPPQSTPAGRTLSLYLVGTKQEAAQTYFTRSGLDVTGQIVYPLPAFDTDRTLRAVAEACDAAASSEASLSSCGQCKGPATAVGGPVRLFDGVMTYAERDPLPATLGMEFRREYSSGAVMDGVFGLGWSSIFDSSAMPADATNGEVIIVKEDRTKVAFRLLTTGQWVQSWPAGGAGGSITGSETLGYVFRDTGGNIVRTFGTNHKLMRLQDLRRGRAVTITYDGLGMPTSIADEIGQWSCSITTSGNHVTSISVIGRPDLTWSYTYTGSLLTDVRTAGAANAWRSYEYANSRMTVVRDASGNAIERHDYDAMGRAISSYDATGDITLITYPASDASGVATTTVTRADNSQATYEQVFANGTAVTRHADGGCSSCGSNDATAVYDSRGDLVRLQNAHGYVTETTYDSAGRNVIGVTTALQPNGCDPAADAGHCRLSSTALAAAVLVRTSASQTMAYTYGDANWPTRPTRIVRDSVLLPGGNVIETISYDAVTGEELIHSVTGGVDTAGTTETHTTTTQLYGMNESAAFNPGGAFQSAWLGLPQPTGLTKSVDGPRTDVADVTTFVYYPIDSGVPGPWRGKLAAVRNAAGHIARLEDYDVFGKAATKIDANGVITRENFDVFGRSITSTVAGVAGCDTVADPLCATDLTTTRTYQASSGALATQQSPAGNLTSYAYDTRGRLQSMTRGTASTALERIDYTYDPTSGKKSSETLSAFENNAWVSKKGESYTYTSDGHLSSVVHADNTRITYSYLPDGTLNTVQDENHATPNTTYAYDAGNRLMTTTQKLATAAGGQIVTRYGYDVQGNLTSVTDPNGNITTYVYDDFGRMLKQTSPVSGVTTYAYDAAGNLVSTIDANGATTTRTYDALSRVTSSNSTRNGTTETLTWSYDDATAGYYGIGNVGTVTEPTGSTTYRYDRRRMLRSEIKTIAGSTYTTSYTYDANGNRTTMVYPNGMTARYTSDFADRPFSLVAGTTNIVTSASYLPFGPLTKLVLGNGTTRTVQYDNRYRITENKYATSSSTIIDYTYAEDNAGNITQIHDATDARYNRDFGYDDLNRLTTANTGSALWGAGSYSYDAMGNMLSSTLGSWKTVSSSYVGTTPKLSTVTENGTPRSVTYDLAGNETAVGASLYSYSPRNTLAGADTSSYAYDARGLLTIATTSLFAVNITPSAITGGTAATGTVTLNTPAAADMTIALVSNNASAASVPPSVIVLAGHTSAAFTVSTAPVTIGSTVTISATYNQYVSTAFVSVLPPDLATLSVSPASVISGGAATGTVLLSGVAASNIAVQLSSNSSAVTVPPSVTVLAGASSANFSIATAPRNAGVTATVTARLGSTTRTATLALAEADLATFSIAPATVANGATATGTVTLSGAATGNIVVSFTSSSADAYASGPITIPPGATSGTVTINTNLQAPPAARTVTITATHGSVSRTSSLTVLPPQVTSLSIAPNDLVGGTSPATATATFDRSFSAPMTLAINSTNTTTVPAQPLTLAAGTTTATAPVLSMPVSAATPVVISTTDNSGTKSTTLTLEPPAVKIASLTLSSGTVVGSNDVTGTVTLTANAPTGGVDVDLSSSDRTRAYVRPYVRVAAGTKTATFTVTSFANAAGNGSATITASLTGTSAAATLTVTTPSTPYLTSVLISTNNGQWTGTVSVNAIASANLTVTMTSSDPAFSVPSKVTVKRGSSGANFSISTTAVTTARLVRVTATMSGTTQRDTILYAPATVPTMNLGCYGQPGDFCFYNDFSFTVAGAASLTSSVSTSSVSLNAPAPAGGVTITIGGSRANVCTVGDAATGSSTLFIPAGAQSASYKITNLGFLGADRGTAVTFTLGAVTYSAFDVKLQATHPQVGQMLEPSIPATAVTEHQTVECAALSPTVCFAISKPVALSAGDASGHYLYTPDKRLLGETEISSASSKSVAYTYFWFGAVPVASIDSSGAVTWYAVDHLGTPVLQSSLSGSTVWRAEHAPYGSIFVTRVGAPVHQPLRFAGQFVVDAGDRPYNVHRWYRSEWGRYTQSDRYSPFESPYSYASSNSLRYFDPTGEASITFGPVQKHLVSIDDVYRECGQNMGSGLKGCARPTNMKWNCHCHCNTVLGFFFRDISITASSIDVFYPRNAASDDVVGRVTVIPPEAILNEEMKHVAAYSQYAASMIDSLNLMEKVPYGNQESCEKGCKAGFDWAQRLFELNIEKVDASHPSGYFTK